jgi:hypothetical protein
MRSLRPRKRGRIELDGAMRYDAHIGQRNNRPRSQVTTEGGSVSLALPNARGARNEKLQEAAGNGRPLALSMSIECNHRNQDTPRFFVHGNDVLQPQAAITSSLYNLPKIAREHAQSS